MPLHFNPNKDQPAQRPGEGYIMATTNYITEQVICDGCGCGILQSDANPCGNADDGHFVFCTTCIRPYPDLVVGSNGEAFIVRNAEGKALAKDGTVAVPPLEGISYGTYAEAEAEAKRFRTR